MENKNKQKIWRQQIIFIVNTIVIKFLRLFDDSYLTTHISNLSLNIK